MKEVRHEFQDHYFFRMNETDQRTYNLLRNKFLASKVSRKGLNRETIIQELSLVHNFVMKGDNQDTLRGLACGAYWSFEGIFINTRQLGHLLNKSKSSINASLSQLGCETAHLPYGKTLQSLIPYFVNFPFEQRQWTFRTISQMKPMIFRPNVETKTKFVLPMIDISPKQTAVSSFTINDDPYDFSFGKNKMEQFFENENDVLRMSDDEEMFF